MGLYANPQLTPPPIPSGSDVLVRRWDFSGVPSDVAKVRRSLVEVLEGHDWTEDGIELARLLASELATNAVRHAGTSFRLTAWVDGVASIAVTDRDPEGEPAVSVRERAEGGIGLRLVAALSSRWGVDHSAEGKSVWFVLDPESVSEVFAAGGPLPRM
jgi:anti-sigma regulatory factor (Ser/Thr protein kinase)